MAVQWYRGGWILVPCLWVQSPIQEGLWFTLFLFTIVHRRGFDPVEILPRHPNNIFNRPAARLIVISEAQHDSRTYPGPSLDVTLVLNMSGGQTIIWPDVATQWQVRNRTPPLIRRSLRLRCSIMQHVQEHIPAGCLPRCRLLAYGWDMKKDIFAFRHGGSSCHSRLKRRQ